MCCWNAGIYFLLLLTQVDFFGSTFYFLESRKFYNYFYFLQSWILGKYLYFLVYKVTKSSTFDNTADITNLSCSTSKKWIRLPLAVEKPGPPPQSFIYWLWQ